MSSGVKTRGSNSCYFEEYLSYKSINSTSEIMFSSLRKKKNFTQIFERHFQMNYSVCIRDGFTLVHLHQCNDLHLAHKPHPQSSSAWPAMPFVNQEHLVLKFTNVL